jgi:hypothetical protein
VLFRSINGKAYPVRNPEGIGEIVFTKKWLETTQDRTTIELLAEGVGPKANPYTVRFHCSALAGRQDSPIEVVIQGGKNEDKIEMGIGLTQMPQETLLADTEAGVFGTWGTQSPAIGTIGMGIVFPAHRFLRIENPSEEDQVVIRAERNVPITYHINCDWLRGRRFDFCPSAQDWLNELRALAAQVKLP